MSLHFKRLAPAPCYPNDTVACLDDNAASEFVSGSLAGAALTKVEGHLAGCRDCRALVAALAGGDDLDSNAATRKRERITESQAGRRPTKTLQIGDRVGRYLVLSTLGAGGMGVVFSAYDPQLDRKIALKLLRANLGANAKEARTRLKREAQAIAQLNHPNVVGVYDVGTTDDGAVYLAMEFVEGDTITTWLKRWPRTWREIVELFLQAGRGLYAAHAVGLLHRDFKPDNVLVGGDGRVRVSDFGLARSVLGPEEAARPAPDASALLVDLTATGTVLGTPRYMPPEQLTGPDIDARSDQFSFCVALYEALYGTHPLPGATSVAMLEHGDRALAPPENTRVPAAIGRAVMRGLEKERNKRYPTMATLLAELTPPPQRSPVRFAALAAVGLLLVGGATAAVVTRNNAPVRIEGNDDIVIKQLKDQVHELQIERQHLEEALLKKEHDLVEFEQIKKELDAKNTEIEQLVDQISNLRAKEKQVQAAKLPDPSQAASAALQSVQHDLEGCFDEWSGRPSPLDIGSSAAVELPKETDLVVTFDVTPSGVAHDPDTRGTTSPSLRLCVEANVTRVTYPQSQDIRTLKAYVLWTPPGTVSTSVRVVGHREAPHSTIDIQ